MSVFQPTVVRNGQKTKATTWSIRYRNAEGKLTQENSFLTKDEAAVRLRDAKRDVKEERAGILTKKFKQHEKPLAEHITDFEKSLEDRETGQDQRQLVIGRLKRAFEASGFKSLGDLNAITLQGQLAKLRKDGLSQQTIKHHVKHAKQFTKFLIEDDRIEVDPFRKLRPPKVTERKHQRRALTPEECVRLFKAAREGKSKFGLTGPEREALYRTAVQTGYRAAELGRMVVANVHLDGDVPHISLSAAKTKNRNDAKIPIRDAATVEFLRTWIGGKSGDARLWPGNWAANRYGGKLIQYDLKAAGITYEIDGRKADFHALRYTFITNAIKSGEHPAAVQRLARHCDINLTFGVYADLGLEDLYHGALRGPAVRPPTATKGESPTQSQQDPTATKCETPEPAEQETGAKSVAPNVALPRVSDRPVVTPDVTTQGVNGKRSRSPRRRKSSPKTQGATGDSSTCRPMSQTDSAERVGFEPTMPLQACRFSRPVQSAALPPLRDICRQTFKSNRLVSMSDLCHPFRHPGA